MNVLERLESEVRSYCRAFPTVFEHAEGVHLRDSGGRSYLDFFSGAGALNYGHNHPALRRVAVDYLLSGGPIHSLDMATRAKLTFLEQFDDVVLRPRAMHYKLQFPGPTGTNAVEAALKLARKVTGRQSVISFSQAFHGMTLGSLAVTGNGRKRAGAGVPLGNVDVMPYAGFLGDDVDSLDILEAFVAGHSSGVELPAAVILETVQAEGGVNVSSDAWLRRLERITRAHGILLIVDDIQVGCGRTGPFFSFERAGIEPDIVCLSKSISGFGLPMALVLIRPEHDVWRPGEHNGTFRGHNLAFVTATAALEFWKTPVLERETLRKAALIEERLERWAADPSNTAVERRGRGLIQGVRFADDATAGRVSRACFERGLLIETAGPHDETLKLLPPLVIDDDELTAGLDLIEDGIEAAAARRAFAGVVA